MPNCRSCWGRAVSSNIQMKKNLSAICQQVFLCLKPENSALLETARRAGPTAASRWEGYLLAYTEGSDTGLTSHSVKVMYPGIPELSSVSTKVREIPFWLCCLAVAFRNIFSSKTPQSNPLQPCLRPSSAGTVKSDDKMATKHFIQRHWLNRGYQVYLKKSVKNGDPGRFLGRVGEYGGAKMLAEIAVNGFRRFCWTNMRSCPIIFTE